MNELGLFGFLVHPLTPDDITKKYPRMMEMAPNLTTKVIKAPRSISLSETNIIKSPTGAQAKGWFIALPVLPEYFTNKKKKKAALRRVKRACEKAARKGAKIIGLGAFTAIVGEKGRKVAKHMSTYKHSSAITTGNTYTVVTAIEGTKKASELMGIDLKEARLAVVGATGSIGKACCRMMMPEVGEMILVSRTPEKLQALAKELSSSGKVIFSTSFEEIKEADVVISVSSADSALLQPEHIKKGAVVCDVARPRDASERIRKERDDVLVIDGGIVKLPGEVNFNCDLGLPQGLAEACIAETIILALEKRYENYTIGDEISKEKIEEIQYLAEKHGFKLAGLRRQEILFSPEEIELIRKNARKGC